MKEKILIVEDQFIEANNLQMILERDGYIVCGIARSVPIALEIIEREKPTMVLLDIFLQGNLTGIDLASKLKEKRIAFVYLSANSNKEILEQAKATRPYGFLVKPFRQKDVLVMLEIARYLHEHSFDSLLQKETIHLLNTIQQQVSMTMTNSTTI
ncbi:MAG TPA: response regulator, partial [Chryseolinea sp.]|nr:response regulator [Chryseolinea sp.]